MLWSEKSEVAEKASYSLCKIIKIQKVYIYSGYICKALRRGMEE